MPEPCASAAPRTSSRCRSLRPMSSAGSSRQSREHGRQKRRGRVSDELVRCARALVGGELRENYAFAVRDGRIAAAGNLLDVRGRADAPETPPFPADRLVVPGFINGHSHAYQILLRGWADDLPFARWRSDALYKVVPQLSPDDIHLTFAAAFNEMLSAGITTVAEFFY